MFGNVAPTEFDLNFSVFRIPVRVSPFFWLLAAILGYQSVQLGIEYLLAWLIVVFASILIHELGHALTARSFGYHPEILLHQMGGLAMYHPDYHHTRSRSIAITLAGPLAGFLLFLLLRLFHDNAAVSVIGSLPEGLQGVAAFSLLQLIYVNWWWSLLNMLPVLPLDGGQICREICLTWSPRRGMLVALYISIITAGSIAAYFFFNGDQYAAILFGLLCASSISAVQSPYSR